jgi:hypothetical protein
MSEVLFAAGVSSSASCGAEVGAGRRAPRGPASSQLEHPGPLVRFVVTGDGYDTTEHATIDEARSTASECLPSLDQ